MLHWEEPAQSCAVSNTSHRLSNYNTARLRSRKAEESPCLIHFSCLLSVSRTRDFYVLFTLSSQHLEKEIVSERINAWTLEAPSPLDSRPYLVSLVLQGTSPTIFPKLLDGQSSPVSSPVLPL